MNNHASIIVYNNTLQKRNYFLLLLIERMGRMKKSSVYKVLERNLPSDSIKEGRGISIKASQGILQVQWST